MAKFKKDDVIEAVAPGMGFDKATVLSVFTGTKGGFKGRELYYLKIMNGFATIPTSAEINYKLVRKK